MRHYILILAMIATGTTFAQTVTDALRLSNSNVTGTARYRALGGAFGALGGDLSAIGDNPASSAVFKRGVASISFGLDTFENTTTYFGNATTSEDDDVSINQAGGVFVIEGAGNSKWKKVTLGFNYDRTSDFDDEFAAVGNNTTSIGAYFLEFAQGVPLDLLQTLPGESVSDLYQFLGEEEGFAAQQAFLGFQSFILEPASNDADETNYSLNTVADTYSQEYLLASRGSNSKASFNLGAQYGKNVYFGLNLNSHISDFRQSTVLFENNQAPAEDDFTTVNAVRFENNLRMISNGFSFQLGSIAKIGKGLRLGVTYDSPTWYTVNEETSQQIRTTSTDNDGTFTTNVNPQVTNIFLDYTLKTPAKYTGSLAYLFGKRGLLSFDYSYRDMTELQFRPTNDPFFNNQNATIDTVLQAVNSYKVGAEIRADLWSFRGGYRFEDSPFLDETTIGNLTGYSAGIGYNFGAVKIDLAYDNWTQDRNQQLFNTGLTDSASIERDNSSIIATLTLGF